MSYLTEEEEQKQKRKVTSSKYVRLASLYSRNIKEEASEQPLNKKERRTKRRNLR